MGQPHHAAPLKSLGPSQQYGIEGFKVVQAHDKHFFDFLNAPQGTRLYVEFSFSNWVKKKTG